MSLDFQVILIEAQKKEEKRELFLFLGDYAKQKLKDKPLISILQETLNLIYKNSKDLKDKIITPQQLNSALQIPIDKIVQRERNMISDKEIAQEREEYLLEQKNSILNIIITSYNQYIPNSQKVYKRNIP